MARDDPLENDILENDTLQNETVHNETINETMIQVVDQLPQPVLNKSAATAIHDDGSNLLIEGGENVALNLFNSHDQEDFGGDEQINLTTAHDHSSILNESFTFDEAFVVLDDELALDDELILGNHQIYVSPHKN